MEISVDKNMEEQLLEIAERLFLERGYASVSTTQIAREAGCNQALVHYYFRTKENLFNTIFEQKFRQFFQSITESLTSNEGDFLQRIELLIGTHFDFLMKNPHLPRLLTQELTLRPELIPVMKKKFNQQPLEILSRLEKELQLEIQKGKLRAINIFDLLFSVVSLNISLFILKPIFTVLLELSTEQQEMILKHRRKEHIDFVLKSVLNIQ